MADGIYNCEFIVDDRCVCERAYNDMARRTQEVKASASLLTTYLFYDETHGQGGLLLDIRGTDLFCYQQSLRKDKYSGRPD